MALTRKYRRRGGTTHAYTSWRRTRSTLCRYDPVDDLQTQIAHLKEFGETVKSPSYKADLIVTLFGYLHLLKKYKRKCVFMKDLKTPGITCYVNKVVADENFGNQLSKCIENGETLILIPLLMVHSRTAKEAHQTMLVLKPVHKTLELYNSYGGKTFPKVLQHFFDNIMEGLSYVAPNNLCSLAFQKEEEKIKRKVRVEYGYCQMWSLFVMELVLKYPQMETSDILKQFCERKHEPAFYRNIILGYSQRISEEIKAYLKKVGFTLGDENDILEYEEGDSANSSYEGTMLTLSQYVNQEMNHILTSS